MELLLTRGTWQNPGLLWAAHRAVSSPSNVYWVAALKDWTPYRVCYRSTAMHWWLFSISAKKFFKWVSGTRIDDLRAILWEMRQKLRGPTTIRCPSVDTGCNSVGFKVWLWPCSNQVETSRNSTVLKFVLYEFAYVRTQTRPAVGDWYMLLGFVEIGVSWRHKVTPANNWRII